MGQGFTFDSPSPARTGGLHSPYFGTEEETADEAMLAGGTRFAPYDSMISDRASLLSAPAASMFAVPEPGAAAADALPLVAPRATSSPHSHVGGATEANMTGREIEHTFEHQQSGTVSGERLGAVSPVSRTDVVTPTPSVYTIDCVTMMSGPVVPVPSQSARIEPGVATRTLEIFPKSGVVDFGKATGGILSNALEKSVSLSLEGGHTQDDIFSGLVDAQKAKPVTKILTLYNTGVDSLHYRLDATDLRLAEMFGQLGVGVTVRFRKHVGGTASSSGGEFGCFPPFLLSFSPSFLPSPSYASLTEKHCRAGLKSKLFSCGGFLAPGMKERIECILDVKEYDAPSSGCGEGQEFRWRFPVRIFTSDVITLVSRLFALLFLFAIYSPPHPCTRARRTVHLAARVVAR